MTDDPLKLMTPEFRVSFPSLLKATKPRNAPAEQEAKYSVVMLFPKGTDLSALKTAAQAAAKDKWGDDIPKELRSPFRNQGEKEYDGYEDGAIFITATSKQRPGVVDQSVNDIIDESEIYPGCWGRATVRAFAYGGKGTGMQPGVSFGLQNFQKLRDDDSLSGRTKPEDDFAPVDSGDNAEGGDVSDLF